MTKHDLTTSLQTTAFYDPLPIFVCLALPFCLSVSFSFNPYLSYKLGKHFNIHIIGIIPVIATEDFNEKPLKWNRSMYNNWLPRCVKRKSVKWIDMACYDVHERNVEMNKIRLKTQKSTRSTERTMCELTGRNRKKTKWIWVQTKTYHRID